SQSSVSLPLAILATELLTLALVGLTVPLNTPAFLWTYGWRVPPPYSPCRRHGSSGALGRYSDCDGSGFALAAARRFPARNATPRPGQKTIPDHMRIPRQRYSLATASVIGSVLTFVAVTQPFP